MAEQLILTGAGAVEYVDAIVPLDNPDTFDGTIQLGVGDYGAPPGTWLAPDRQFTSTDGQSITASLLIGNGHTNPVSGTYWLWYRATDDPEVIIGPARASRFTTTDPAGTTVDSYPPFLLGLSIGTVTTGAPGSQAAASLVGGAPTPTLNLTIPQGPSGIDLVDNGDGTFTATGTGAADNGDGTFTIGAA